MPKNSFHSCREYELWTNEAFLKPFCKRKRIEIVKTLDPYDDLGDFLVKRKRTSAYLEVKAERPSYPNLALEHWSDEGVRPGWMMTSEADWLLYLCGGDTDTPLYVYMKMQELKEWFMDNRDQHDHRIRNPKRNETQDNKTAFYAIPREILRTSGLFYVEYPVEAKIHQCVGGIDWPKP